MRTLRRKLARFDYQTN